MAGQRDGAAFSALSAPGALSSRGLRILMEGTSYLTLPQSPTALRTLLLIVVVMVLIYYVANQQRPWGPIILPTRHTYIAIPTPPPKAPTEGKHTGISMFD